MVKMITLFGEDLSKLKYNDLKRERRCQSFLLTRIRIMLKQAHADLDKHPDSNIQKDKITFFEMYQAHLEALIEACDYWLDRRYEPLQNSYSAKPQWAIRKDNEKRRKRQIRDNALACDWRKSRGALVVSWDRDKFFQIARDRGYQTEEYVISEVAKELKFDITKARLALNKGWWTWGQVLCLGAFLQMSPKEFCDTFLAGYFTEQYGEYRAGLENLSKSELLKKVMRSDPLVGIEKVEIEVGADGRPVDEEEWLDD